MRWIGNGRSYFADGAAIDGDKSGADAGLNASSAYAMNARRDPGIEPRFLGEFVDDGLLESNARVVASNGMIVTVPRLIYRSR